MGMAVHNAELEQLADKVKGGDIIMVFAKAAGEDASAWAAKCAEQKQQYPSRTLCYSVSVALQDPQAIKFNSKRIVPSAACMSCNAARQRRAVAVLKGPYKETRQVTNGYSNIE